MVNKKAFTLIETLAALAVVSIALIALIQLHLVNLKLTRRSITLNQAWVIADNLINTALTENPLKTGISNGSITLKNNQFNWQRRVVPLPKSSGISNLPIREIQVGVSWQTGDHLKQIELSTYTLNTEP